MGNDPILCDVRDGVAIVTLNNPPLNLVNRSLTMALGRTLADLLHNGAVRVLVITGAGERAFCAGSDIGEFAEMMDPGQVVPRKLERQKEVFGILDNFPKPTIAAINGIAYGGGLEIAVCCDLLVLEEHCRIALPEIKLGVFPSSGGPARVTRRIGESRAKEMMFLGEPIDAGTALAWGLVNRVVPKGASLDAALGMASVLVERPRYALQLCKKAVDLSLEMSLEEALVQSLELSDKAFSSPECKEGVRAFLKKDRADFSKC